MVIEYIENIIVSGSRPRDKLIYKGISNVNSGISDESMIQER